MITVDERLRQSRQWVVDMVIEALLCWLPEAADEDMLGALANTAWNAQVAEYGPGADDSSWGHGEIIHAQQYLNWKTSPN